MIYGKKLKANNFTKKMQDGKKKRKKIRKRQRNKGKKEEWNRRKDLEKVGRDMRKLFLGKGRFKIRFWFASIFSAFYLFKPGSSEIFTIVD